MPLAVRALLAGLIGLVLIGAPALAADEYHWVQYGQDGTAEARALVGGGECPAIDVDGRRVAMAERAGPTADFPLRVCAAALPAGARSATLGASALALPVADPQRILVIGDTGCRIQGKFVQLCDEPAAWPYPILAAEAARLKPDLIIHVGDYHYRETACPAGNAGCAGSPFGYDWAPWQADFFAPSGALLGAAPWIFVRGNHEDCTRAGTGWSRMLDPGPLPVGTACIAEDPPYRIALGGLDLVVLDVAVADQAKEAPAQVAAYRGVFATAAGLARTKPTWLLLHRPVWGVVEVKGEGSASTVIGDNKTLAPAARGAISANVTLMLSGHIHTFEALSYAADLPPQLVVGLGGTYLDGKIPADPTGLVVGGVRIARGTTQGGFGFLLLERQPDGAWAGTLYDPAGATAGRCRLAGRDLDCRRG